MSEQMQYAIMEWPTDGGRVSVHHLKYIVEPKKSWNLYEVGNRGKATFGKTGEWQFIIHAVGPTSASLQDKLRDIAMQLGGTDASETEAVIKEKGTTPAKETNKQQNRQTTSTTKKRTAAAKDTTRADLEKKSRSNSLNKILTQRNSGEDLVEVTRDKDDGGNVEAVMRDGTVEAAMRDGTVEAVMRDGTVEAAMMDGTVEAAMRDGTVEAAVRDGTVEAAVRGGNVEAVMRDGNVEAAMTGGNVEATMRGGIVEETGQGGNEEAVIRGGNVEAAMRGGNVEAAIRGGNVEAAIRGGIMEETGEGGNVEAAMRGGNMEAAMKSWNGEAAMSSEGAVGFGNVSSTPYPSYINHNQLVQDGGAGWLSNVARPTATYTSANYVRGAYDALYNETYSGMPHSGGRSYLQPALHQYSPALQSEFEGCHSCCDTVQLLVNRVQELENSVDRLSKKKEKRAKSTMVENTENSDPMTEHNMDSLMKAISAQRSVSGAVFVLLNMLFSIQEMSESSVMGIKNQKNTNKPALDTLKRAKIEDAILAKFPDSDVRSIRNAMRDRMKLHRRKYNGTEENRTDF